MRPAGLSSGIDQDRPDYTVVTGEWEVGRIYQTRGGPDSLRWFWSMTVNGPMTRSALVATLEEAKAQLQASWDAWKAWAMLEEVPKTCAAAHAGGRGGRERKPRCRWGQSGAFNGRFALGWVRPGHRTERRGQDDTPKRKMVRARLPRSQRG